MSEQGLTELMGAIYFAIAGLFDREALLEANETLKDYIETGAIKDVSAIAVLDRIITATR